MDSVASEWCRRVDAEYHSAAATQAFTLWLMQIGASPDLIRDGLAIADDELAHAELSFEVYCHAGGSEMPELPRESLGLARYHQDLELDLLITGTRIFCLGETVAVPLFQRMRKECSVESARRALDRILIDEVRHRDFGWTFLEWMLPIAGEERRAKLQTALPTLTDTLVQSYQAGILGHDVSDEERAWGLISGPEYEKVLARAWERDFRPRFERLGFKLGVYSAPHRKIE